MLRLDAEWIFVRGCKVYGSSEQASWNAANGRELCMELGKGFDLVL